MAAQNVPLLLDEFKDVRELLFRSGGGRDDPLEVAPAVVERLRAFGRLEKLANPVSVKVEARILKNSQQSAS